MSSVKGPSPLGTSVASPAPTTPRDGGGPTAAEAASTAESRPSAQSSVSDQWPASALESEWQAESAGAALQGVAAERASTTSPEVRALLDAYLHQRGDAARKLQGFALGAEVGAALQLRPNHIPRTPFDEALLERGAWPFYQGDAAATIRTVTEALKELAGGREPVALAVLPVVYVEPESKVVRQVALFRVDGEAGEPLGFVDESGRRYASLAAWREENSLPPGRIVYPADGHLKPGPDGRTLTVDEATHATVDTPLEHVFLWLDRIGTVAGFAVGAAVLLGTGGVLVPVAGALLAVGYGGRAALNLLDAHEHGESLNPLESERARADWLTLGASVTGLGGSAATVSAARQFAASGSVTSSLGRSAPLLNVTAQLAGTAQATDSAVLLARRWDEMTVEDRMLVASQLAFFGAGTVRQGVRVGGIANLYSLRAAREQLGIRDGDAVESEPSLGVAPAGIVQPGTSQHQPSVRAKLDSHAFFGEDARPEVLPTPQLASSHTLAHLRNWAGQQDFSGLAARLNAARFVDRPGRTDGDFRYAAGELPYRAWARADARLQELPKGRLADALSVDLLGELATVLGGHDGGRPGTPAVSPFRDFEQRSAPLRLSGARLRSLRDLGVSAATVHKGEVGEVALVFPAPALVRERLSALVEETKQALRVPRADVVRVGADFAQRFAALQPFRSANEVIGRLVMDRILAEADVPPPIFSKLDIELTSSAKQYEAEVRAGVLRMREAASTGERAQGPYDYFRSLLPDVALPAPQRNRLLVDGRTYTQGRDGFMYDEAGRPHLFADDGELFPMSQLEHYFVVRRARQSADPRATLSEYTETSRRRFEALVGQPSGAGSTGASRTEGQPRVRSDLQAIAADNTYRLELRPRGNERLVALYDFERTAAPELLFRHSEWPAPSVTFAISRYLQLDLEMWHVQRALERAGDGGQARQLFAHRATLFSMAKRHLAGMVGAPTAENPSGARFPIDRTAIERSPLAFETLEGAIAAHGDDRVMLWRGDIVLSRLIGMAPDYNPLNPDALQLAARRGARAGTTSIIADLDAVASDSLGTGYLCYTSDLAVLAQEGGFADRFSRATVSLRSLPRPLSAALRAMLLRGADADPAAPPPVHTIDSLRAAVGFALGRTNTPPGKLDVSGLSREAFATVARSSLPADLAELALARFDEAHASARTPVGLALRFRALLTDPPVLIDTPWGSEGASAALARTFTQNVQRARDAFRLRLGEHDTLVIETNRRAFLVELDKADALPGPGTLGGRRFEAEQEVTGLGKVAPWRILETLSRGDLERDSPSPTPSATSRR